MSRINWQEYVDRMFAEGEVRAFHRGGSNGSVFQAESKTLSINWDSVSGSYFAGGIEFANEPDEAWDALFERVNAEGKWIDEPLFWESDEDPEEYVGA